uniref:sialic acid-binding Ig-like lectin 13 n=1 Tax=Scatophagus argus TaxID=75038 RepID=UPI001ED82618|nr:sialic acid-binding Ig-like lectin 13 [Scatophagus argus]
MDKDIKMMVLLLFVAAITRPVVTRDWKAEVVQTLDALVTSCVVIPCTFTHPQEKLPTSRLRGIWQRSKNRDERIYYEDSTQVLENFRGRTRLLGQLGQDNCTLEITDIKDHDNGPFCFRIELARTETDTSTTDKFSFVDSCVTLTMLTDPPKPTLTHSKTAFQDQPYTVVCSVTHTCPSHMPTITWSRGTVDEITEDYKKLPIGLWQVDSILTFIPGENDDHSEITCTAKFHGRKESSSTLNLYLKRTTNYNHIIIPTVVGIATAVIFGVVCIFMIKKYKRRITELQNQDGSMWNRLSRISRRFRSGGPGPSSSDHRRPNRDMLDLGHISNSMNSKSCVDQKVNKPRFPSPKSQPKSCNYKEELDDGDDYINTADLNVYGNL